MSSGLSRTSAFEYNVRFLPVFGACFLIALLATPAAAVQPPQTGRVKPSLDIRIPDDLEQRKGFRMRTPTAAQLALADAFRAEIEGLTLRWDGMAGSPRWVAAPAGSTLSSPHPGTPEEAARDFLRHRAGLLGIPPAIIHLLEVSSVVPAKGGGAHVYFNQRVDRIEVFGGRA